MGGEELFGSENSEYDTFWSKLRNDIYEFTYPLVLAAVWLGPFLTSIGMLLVGITTVPAIGFYIISFVWFFVFSSWMDYKTDDYYMEY